MRLHKQNIYEQIYFKLEKIGVFQIESHTHLQSPGFMDLVVEKLGENHYALTHYFEQNGDLCPDPDMEIRVFPEQKMAEALSLQDCFDYRCVYPEPDTINLRKGDTETILNTMNMLLRLGWKKFILEHRAKNGDRIEVSFVYPNNRVTVLMLVSFN